MAVTAKIVSGWSDGVYMYAEVVAPSVGPPSPTTFQLRTTLLDSSGLAKSQAQLQDDLITELKGLYYQQFPPADTPAALPGTVNF